MKKKRLLAGLLVAIIIVCNVWSGDLFSSGDDVSVYEEDLFTTGNDASDTDSADFDAQTGESLFFDSGESTNIVGSGDSFDVFTTGEDTSTNSDDEFFSNGDVQNEEDFFFEGTGNSTEIVGSENSFDLFTAGEDDHQVLSDVDTTAVFSNGDVADDPFISSGDEIGLLSDEEVELFSSGDDELEITKVGASIVDSGTCGDNLTWTLDSEGTLTISGEGDMANYSWSSQKEKSPWAASVNNIKKVVINSGVTNIGENAFFSCIKLTNITIPSSVTSIGDDAFSLTSVSIRTIPSSVTHIGERAFYNCTYLTNITIPSSVTSIGDYAFSWCGNLDSINVDSGNANYSSQNGVLFNIDKTKVICCPMGKTGDYTIPSSVTSIGNGAFLYCDSLTNITIPNSVTSIGNSAFERCSSLTEITIPSSVTSIGDNAFERCTSLTKIIIPSSVTSIGDNAFLYYQSYYNSADGTHFIYYPLPDVTIYGYTSSRAETYAAENSIPFVALDAQTPTPTPTPTPKPTATPTPKPTATPTPKPTATPTPKPTATPTPKPRTIKLSKPSAPSLTNTASGIGISWKAVPQARSYGIICNKNGKVIKTKTTNTKILFKGAVDGDNMIISIMALGYNTSNAIYKSSTVSDGSKIVRLGSTSLKGSSPRKNTVTLSWPINTKSGGYQIRMAMNSSFTSNVKSKIINGLSTKTQTIARLTSGKTYYFQIRPVKVISGKTYYGPWSNIVAIKVK